jgi:hypothetical protein
LPGLDQDTRAHQTFDDARGSLGRHLQGVTNSVDRDEGHASVDDLFENGPDHFGTTGGVATVQVHNASLRARVWYCWLGVRHPNFVAVGHDAIQ